MSDIAQALAKAKERTGHTTAPFLAGARPGASLNPEREAAIKAALRRARYTQRFWITLGIISLPLTGFILWTNLRPAPTAPATTPHGTESIPAAHVATTTTTTPASHQSYVGGIYSPDAPAYVFTTPNADLLAETARLHPDVAAAVSALQVTAVMTGEKPRVVIAGKTYRSGETVGSDLVFAGIADGQLYFADKKGALYARRF